MALRCMSRSVASGRTLCQSTGARLGDGGKPFADFRCDIATAAAACQFKAQQALGSSIAGHQFQQQIGQPVCARAAIFGVEGLVGSHGAVLRGPRRVKPCSLLGGCGRQMRMAWPYCAG
jgi:hypothetical protein